MSSNNNLKLTQSSANVFEDLGFKDAKQRLAKAKLASRIHDIIDERNLNQVEAALAQLRAALREGEVSGDAGELNMKKIKQAVKKEAGLSKKKNA